MRCLEEMFAIVMNGVHVFPNVVYPYANVCVCVCVCAIIFFIAKMSNMHFKFPVPISKPIDVIECRNLTKMRIAASFPEMRTKYTMHCNIQGMILTEAACISVYIADNDTSSLIQHQDLQFDKSVESVIRLGSMQI